MRGICAAVAFGLICLGAGAASFFPAELGGFVGTRHERAVLDNLMFL